MTAVSEQHPDRAGTTESDHDLLLFSDIHLGSDLKKKDLRRAGSIEALRGDDAIDRALGGFLDDYAERARPGRRWRLILDGDVVDFIGMNVTPRDIPGPAGFDALEHEEIYGLDPGADRCAWMMRQVVRRHPIFFERLAAFLARGNDLVIIRGNHDAAFFWPEVQRTFVSGVLDGGRRAGLSVQALSYVATAVQFEDWFYLEPGRIYAEHGHAHDEFCADPGVSPTDFRRPDLLSQPTSTLTLRYFGNRFPTLDLDEVDQWTLGQFLRWAFVTENPVRVGLAFANTVALLLLPFLRRALRSFRRSRSAHDAMPEIREVTGEHEIAARIRDRLARHLHGAERFAVGVARLVRRTARVEVKDILQMLYLDRAANLSGGVFCCVGCVALNVPWSVRLGMVAALLTGALLFDQHLKVTRSVSIGPKLRRAADDIAALLDVPVVVMGHSHKAVDTVLADGKTRYVNLGTWMGAAQPARAAEHGLPHLVIRDGPAEFLRWYPPAPKT
jgi:UDP-2,3-diacylglucosamine pyrophosphatase LpxH